MPEAEVSLRLALWLLEQNYTEGLVEVAIDGAQVKVGETIHFDLAGFMERCGWKKRGSAPSWRCEWTASTRKGRILVHSNPGRGDVVAPLKSGKTLRVECKKGPLTRSRSSQEYPLIREALGQLLTIGEIGDHDILAVAVPHAPKFEVLAERWRHAPLIKRFGILILTVDRCGTVFGFESEDAG